MRFLPMHGRALFVSSLHTHSLSLSLYIYIIHLYVLPLILYHAYTTKDGKFQKQEFTITPSTGSVEPHGAQPIKLELCSTSVKEYEVFLTVDIMGVGEGLLSIPVLATCKAPNVDLKEVCLSRFFDPIHNTNYQ